MTERGNQVAEDGPELEPEGSATSALAAVLAELRSIHEKQDEKQDEKQAVAALIGAAEMLVSKVVCDEVEAREWSERRALARQTLGRLEAHLAVTLGAEALGVVQRGGTEEKRRLRLAAEALGLPANSPPSEVVTEARRQIAQAVAIAMRIAFQALAKGERAGEPQEFPWVGLMHVVRRLSASDLRSAETRKAQASDIHAAEPKKKRAGKDERPSAEIDEQAIGLAACMLEAQHRGGVPLIDAAKAVAEVFAGRVVKPRNSAPIDVTADTVRRWRHRLVEGAGPSARRAVWQRFMAWADAPGTAPDGRAWRTAPIPARRINRGEASDPALRRAQAMAWIDAHGPMPPAPPYWITPPRNGALRRAPAPGDVAAWQRVATAAQKAITREIGKAAEADSGGTASAKSLTLGVKRGKPVAPR